MEGEDNEWAKFVVNRICVDVAWSRSELGLTTSSYSVIIHAHLCGPICMC
jgi:hypothetical protein